MITPRVLPRVGPLVSTALGPPADDEGPAQFTGVTQDPGSGTKTPANAQEWDIVVAGIGLGLTIPNHLWLCQEVSGPLNDALGSLNLSASGTVNYQQALPGFTRKCVVGAALSASTFFGVGVDTSAAGFTVLGYINSGIATVLRPVITYGSVQVVQLVGSTLRLLLGGLNISALVGTAGSTNLVGLTFDPSASQCHLYTSAEHLTLSVGASAGSTLALVLSSLTDTTTAAFGWATAWDGVIVTPLQMKSLYGVMLNASVPWT